MRFFIFKDIQATFIDMLENSSLTKNTKKEALKKIKTMGVHLGWANSMDDLFLQPIKRFESASTDYTFEENCLLGCQFQFQTDYSKPREKLITPSGES